MFFGWDVEIARTSVLLLELLHCGSLLFDALQHRVGNKRWPVDIVALLGLCNVEPVHDGFVLLRVLRLLRETMIE